MNTVAQSFNVYELLIKPKAYYARMLNSRLFPWLTLILGPLVFGLALSLLNRNYYTKLENGTQILVFLVFQGFLVRLMFYVMASVVFMLIAGYDSEPFRVLAFSSSIVLFWSLLLLVYAVLFPVQVSFPNSVGVPTVTRIDDLMGAFHTLQSHPAVTFFMYSTFLVFVLQLAWAYYGLLESGANRTNAKTAIAFCVLSALFCSIIGLFVPALPAGFLQDFSQRN